MTSIFGNIRFYILLFSGALSIFFYYYFPQITQLTQAYALTALAYLYLTLLAGPFCYTVKFFPFRGEYLKARRALGVSAFYFGLIHASFAFFGQLGGFAGLPYLTNSYLLAILFSFSALVIFFIMTLTATDYLIEKLTFPVWKAIHRLIYIASFLVLIHALMLGSHFSDLSYLTAQTALVAGTFLLFLEALRVDAFILKNFPNAPQFGITMLLLFSIIGAGLFYLFAPNNSIPQLGIHSAHIQLAQDIQSGTQNNLPNIPGLKGDRTKRYTVDFDTEGNLLPNQEIGLNFDISDASSGNKTLLYQQINGKLVHLIIVNSDLTYFDHIHPEQTTEGFTIKHKFPKDDTYHLYLDFQPLGAIEQQIAHTINIGNIENPILSSATEDGNLTKVFGDYEVTLEYPKPLKSPEISVGQQILKFTIRDAASKDPIINLKPYLEAFGHLVMINQETFDYIHVHPKDLTAPSVDANGGPVVEFMPIGIYGTIKPGIYRVFAQFNPNNNLFTSDFTIKIE